MRILHLAYRDTSGVPGRWAAAHRAQGHEARLLVELKHPYGYDADETILRWTPGTKSADERYAKLERWCRQYHAIMAYDHPYYLDAAVASGKPVLFRALGQSSREHADEITELLQEPNVMRATAGTADLSALLRIELAGAPYPLPAPAHPSGKLVLCHAPSDRDAKGTERVLRAAEATGWGVDLIEDTRNAVVLQRKRKADLVVDTCGPNTVPDGYGVNGVEAMALGLPLVSSASERVAKALADVGSPAVLVANEDGLKVALEWLRDADTRSELGRQGRAFVQRFHSPELRAAEDLEALREPAAA